MTVRNKGIIAYGTDDDRTKLAALAQSLNQSGSEVVIGLIRSRFQEVFGDMDAKDIIAHRP